MLFAFDGPNYNAEPFQFTVLDPATEKPLEAGAWPAGLAFGGPHPTLNRASTCLRGTYETTATPRTSRTPGISTATPRPADLARPDPEQVGLRLMRAKPTAVAATALETARAFFEQQGAFGFEVISVAIIAMIDEPVLMAGRAGAAECAAALLRSSGNTSPRGS